MRKEGFERRISRMNADQRPSAKSAVKFTVSWVCPYRRHPFAVVRPAVLVSVVVSAVAAARAAVPSDVAAVAHAALAAAARAVVPRDAAAVAHAALVASSLGQAHGEPAAAVVELPRVAAVVVPAVAQVRRLVHLAAALALVGPDAQFALH